MRELGLGKLPFKPGNLPERYRVTAWVKNGILLDISKVDQATRRADALAHPWLLESGVLAPGEFIPAEDSYPAKAYPNYLIRAEIRISSQEFSLCAKSNEKGDTGGFTSCDGLRNRKSHDFQEHRSPEGFSQAIGSLV